MPNRVELGWSVERVMEETERAIENGESGPTLPVYQWASLHRLEGLRQLFASGEGYALMLAIVICARHDLVMPKWVARAYTDAFDKVNGYRVRSWDEAFGARTKKGAHLEPLRQRWLIGPGVLMRVREIKREKPETPIDNALFERVGQEFGIGRALASELYYESLDATPYLKP